MTRASLPDWLPISPEARRRAWEVAQSAPEPDEETVAAVALLAVRRAEHRLSPAA